MIIKQKIQAFTLSEMIVVMILTSMVVGMAFTVLGLVQKHMQTIQDNFSKNTEINKLQQAMWLDFNRYTNIKINKSGDALLFATEINSVTYKFTNTNIIKDKDTFNLICQQKTSYFAGNQVQEGQIDALKLKFSKAFENQVLFVFKQNDAATYVNNSVENQNTIGTSSIQEKRSLKTQVSIIE